MSKLFQVVDASTNCKITIQAAHVVSIDDDFGSQVKIRLIDGRTIITRSSTYRSIRGYVAKGLGE